jgi:hypothetical protein
VSEVHKILQGMAEMTQENILPANRKQMDIMFSGDDSVVILALKKLAGDGPTPAKLVSYHMQLAGYVKRSPLCRSFVVGSKHNITCILDSFRSSIVVLGSPTPCGIWHNSCLCPCWGLKQTRLTQQDL